MTFHRPATLSDALTLRAATGMRILAGGTDFYPALRDGPVTGPVLDITAVPELRHIRKEKAHWSFGANTTWTDVLRAKLPPAFDGLKLAAREVGSIQIQNRGTIAGNLCNASPAADGAPPLLTLDAEVEIASRRGIRHEALTDFITGNRRTTLASDEMVARIRVPLTSATGTSSFIKLGARKYLVISIAMVATRLELTKGKINKAAIAVGACAATAKRLPELEAAITGLAATKLARLTVPLTLLAPLSPIDDVRAPASYRLDAVATLIRQCLLDTLP